MHQKQTNIFLSTDGDVVINELPEGKCLECIESNSSCKAMQVLCPLSNEPKRVALKFFDTEKLYVCDNKEKKASNFLSLVNLLIHGAKEVVQKYHKIREEIRNSARTEIDTFKHNIESINANSLHEFYSLVSIDYENSNYGQLQENIKKVVDDAPDKVVDLLARLTRYNLNIKTELFITSKLDCIESNPNFKWGNPRDAIMKNVYMLYPDFKKRNIYINVDEYRQRFDIDFEALQVATFYILGNATKYCSPHSNLYVLFTDSHDYLCIEFRMNSLFVPEAESSMIFSKNYIGEQAKKTGRSGKGLGLYWAKKLITLCNGSLDFNNGIHCKRGAENLYYSENTFVIKLPYKPKS